MDKSLWTIAQAFIGAMLALWLLRTVERHNFSWIMWRGGGTVVALGVFLGILGYHLGQQYIASAKQGQDSSASSTRRKE